MILGKNNNSPIFDQQYLMTDSIKTNAELTPEHLIHIELIYIVT